MKLGKRVTRWERTREVKVVNIVRKVDHVQSKRQSCNGCGRLLHLHLPVYLVGVVFPEGSGSGAALCCECGQNAEKEVAANEMEVTE